MLKDRFSIRFPPSEPDRKSQDEEFCILNQNGEEKCIRLHDYPTIYGIPGLYEYLFCERLEYRSPEVVISLLLDQISKSSSLISDLSVLDVGAGNGIVGEALRWRGVKHIVGIDIVPEAAWAAQRDRPGTYDEYYVEDLQNLSPDTKKKLRARDFNCMVSVGALGFGDIPSSAFVQAYKLIIDQGWIAFNINEKFMQGGDRSGFSFLIKQMIDEGSIEVRVNHRYQHRLSTSGVSIFYIALVGKKRNELNPAM
ncbi:MAG: methyltransferase domain-containing protein [Pseudomonadota bacterium]